MQLIIFLMIFTLCLPSFSKTKTYILEVKEAIKVYKEPNLRSAVIDRLKPGQKLNIRLSKKKYYIRISYPEKRIEGGYVYTKHFRKSRIKKAQVSFEKDFVASQSSRRSYSLSLNYQAIQMSQQGYQDVINEVNYQFSEFISSHSGFELQLSLPAKSQWQWQIGLVSMKTQFESTAIMTSINKKDIPVSRIQELIGLSFNARYFFNDGDNYYGLFGLELDKGISLELTYDDQSLVGADGDLPLFVIGRAGIGAQWFLFKSVFISPEARLGIDFNSDPMTLVYRLSLGLGFLL